MKTEAIAIVKTNILDKELGAVEEYFFNPHCDYMLVDASLNIIKKFREKKTLFNKYIKYKLDFFDDVDLVCLGEYFQQTDKNYQITKISKTKNGVEYEIKHYARNDASQIDDYYKNPKTLKRGA